MKTVTIVGNFAQEMEVFDGGRIKTKLYRKILEDNKFKVYSIDICNYKKKIIKILFQLVRLCKKSDTILLMAGPNGCRKLIPVIMKIKRKKTRFVFCPLGIGTLDNLIKKMTASQVNDFMECRNFHGVSDIKMQKHICKIDKIIVQTEKLKKCYENFYNIKNVAVLRNFRDISIVQKKFEDRIELKCLFLSRVNVEKGIFDLMEAFKEIKEYNITLDIFGELQLNDFDLLNFKRMISENRKIKYCGTLNHLEIFNTIKKYDLFIFPSKYHGEGMPGVIIESMLVGTPVLCSNFAQIIGFIKNKENGLLFEQSNVSDLISNIIWIKNNKSELQNLSVCAQQTVKDYTRAFNEEELVKLVGGLD